MAYKLIKAAMVALVGIGLTATATYAGSGMDSTMDYMNDAKRMKSGLPEIATLGAPLGYVTSYIAPVNIVDGALFTLSDKKKIGTNAVSTFMRMGNEPLYRGTDRLSPTMQAITQFYGTDRLSKVPSYDAARGFGANQIDWSDFQEISLNTSLLRGTDRI